MCALLPDTCLLPTPMLPQRAVQFQQYKTLRTVIEAGLEYYKEDGQART